MNVAARGPLGRRQVWLILGGLVLVGIVRILLTYPKMAQTVDERSHIATGLEWLDAGEYTLNPENPPLARVVVSLGPYLSGAVEGDTLEERVLVLKRPENYPRVLYLARLGNLLFFVAATVLVWACGAALFDDVTGLVGAAIFTLLPPVLAHGGLATTDMAATAGTVGSILALTRWLERPTLKRAVLLGVAIGLTTLLKFSATVFVVAAAGLIVLWRAYTIREHLFHPRWREVWTLGRRLFVAVVVMGFVIWAGYRFSVGPLRTEADRPYAGLDDRLAGSETLLRLAHAVIEAPIYPAPEFVAGIGQMLAHSGDPHTTYLLGETREAGGFLLFFPVAIAVKSPLPFLILVVLGLWLLVRPPAGGRAWRRWVPVLSAIGILVIVMQSGVNVGLRHVLPIYPFFCLLAAWALVEGRRSRGWERLPVRGALLGLGGWLVVGSALAHPDYLSSFNLLAGSHPEEILADSDLDWGQDVGRLAEALKARGIEQVSLGVFTRAELEVFDWPAGRVLLEPSMRPAGWVAASLYRIKVSREFAWLEAYTPVDTIGTSIRLYYFENPPEAPPPPADGAGSEPRS